MKYLVIIEKAENSYGAYVPDLPGCVAVGETESEVLNLINEAIELHLDESSSADQALPQTQSYATYAQIPLRS